jgi:hypothetical protein
VAPDWWIHEVGLDSDTSNYRDERRVSVATVARELGNGGELEYRYDMGDGWRHRIVIDAPPPHWPRIDLPLPTCLAGVFDPKGFDLNRLNREWRGARKRRQ